MADMEVEEAPPPEPLGPREVADPVLPLLLDSQLRELELRSYQQCVLQRARERNVIMVGATGIGKTLVAVKLLQELDVSDKRIAFFLVTTRTLAHQQYQRVRRSTKLKVERVMGNDVTLWKKDQWAEKLKKNNVIISTAQILLNLLNRGREYLTMDNISLIIIDECHRASKQHPYNKIMQLYDPKAPVKPKIFGMTAVPTPTCGENLHCTYCICPRWEVEDFAANAPLSLQRYESFKRADVDPVVAWALTALCEDIRATCPNIDELKDACRLEHVTNTFNDVGLYCALRHLHLVLSHFLHASATAKRTSCVFLHPVSKLCTYLYGRLLHPSGPRPSALVPQLRRLVTILRERRDEDPEHYRAMIFVQKRIVCRTICDYLRILPDFGSRVAFVTGQTSSDGISGHRARSFTRTMAAFAAGDVDTLVATDVLSEGIDVPDCSVVIVYDDLKDATTFVQMRGRARKRSGGGSSFIVMVPDEQQEQCVKKLEAEAEMFHNDTFLEAQPVTKKDRASELPMRALYPDFIYRVESTGAEMNLDNSVPYLFMLCQRTRECQKYGLGPIFDLEADETYPDLYRCRLTLPAFFKIPSVTTDLFRAKHVARAVAAYEATVLLHYAGLIDDYLNPPVQTSFLHNYKDFVKDLGQPDRVHLTNPRAEHLGLDPIPLPPQLLAPPPPPEVAPTTEADGPKAADSVDGQDRTDGPQEGTAEGEAPVTGKADGEGTEEHSANPGPSSPKDDDCPMDVDGEAGGAAQASVDVPTSPEAAKDGTAMAGVETDEDPLVTLHLYRIRGTSSLTLAFTKEPRMGNELDEADPWEVTPSPLRLLPHQSIEARRSDVAKAAQFAALLSYHAMHGRHGFLVQSEYFVHEGQEVFVPGRDKGYLLLPIRRDGEVWWDAVHKAVAQPTDKSLWPLPEGNVDEWVALSHAREPQRPRLYVLRRVLDETLGERLAFWKAMDLAAAKELGVELKTVTLPELPKRDTVRKAPEPAKADQPEKKGEGKNGRGSQGQANDEDGGQKDKGSNGQEEGKEEGKEEPKKEKKRRRRDEVIEGRVGDKPWEPTDLVCKTLNSWGEEIRLEPCYPMVHWEAADPSQPLLLAYKVDDSSSNFRHSLKGERAYHPQRVVTVAPQYLTFLRVPAACYLDMMRVLPWLYKWEIERTVRELMHRMRDFCPMDSRGLELIREATTKPNYERLETLGDSYLKAQIGLFVFRMKPVLDREGLMSAFRDNLACNRRLLKCAREKGLDGFLHLRKSVVNEPFKIWNPPFLQSCVESHEVHFKTVSDIVESLLGAHCIHNGHKQADEFLRWMGLPVACGPECDSMKEPSKAMKFRHEWVIKQRDCKCWTMSQEVCMSYGFGPPHVLPKESILLDLARFEDILGYAFNNKWLLVQALTHPSYGRKPWPTDDPTYKTVTVGDYQRLEFLGDALLDYMCMAHFFTTHPGWDPGRLTAEKAALVGNHFLAWVAADQLSVHKFMYYDSVELAQVVSKYLVLPDRDPEKAPKALADIVEALVAAVYIDAQGDFQMLYSVFYPLLSNVPNVKLRGNDDFDLKMPLSEDKVGRRARKLLKEMFGSLDKLLEATMEECEDDNDDDDDDEEYYDSDDEDGCRLRDWGTEEHTTREVSENSGLEDEEDGEEASDSAREQLLLIRDSEAEDSEGAGGGGKARDNEQAAPEAVMTDESAPRITGGVLTSGQQATHGDGGTKRKVPA